MDITDEQLSEARDFLGQVVKSRKVPLSQYEAVYRIRHQLKKAVKRKVSYEELAHQLNSQGWDITPITLRQYLSQAFARRKSQTQTKAQSRKKPELDGDSSHLKSESKSKQLREEAHNLQGDSQEELLVEMKLTEPQKIVELASESVEKHFGHNINGQSNRLVEETGEVENFDDDEDYQHPLITIRK